MNSPKKKPSRLLPVLALIAVGATGSILFPGSPGTEPLRISNPEETAEEEWQSIPIISQPSTADLLGLTAPRAETDR